MARKRKLEGEEEGESHDGSMGWEHGVDEVGILGGAHRARKRYVGVRQRLSGRWVAEIKDTIHKIRVWLGTFDTAGEAARAYDEAACLLRGSNTRTNFWPSPTDSNQNPALPSKITKLLVNRLKARGHENGVFHAKDQSGLEIEEMENTKFDDFIEIPSNNSDYFLNYVDQVVYDDKEIGEECKTKGEEDNKVEIIDFNFVDNVESSKSYYSPFEIAHEMVVPFHEQENNGEDQSMLTEAMKRMRYERNFSASLYAFNGVSECLKLKVGSQNDGANGESDFLSKLINDFSGELKGKEKEEGADVDVHGEFQELNTRQENSREMSSFCSLDSSSSSSSANKVEWSLWNSLDLPPISMLFSG